jgi:hypothetical protein
LPVFYVYVHNGEAYSTDDMECSPSAAVVKREFASRVRSGKGKSCYVLDLDEITPETVRKTSEEEAWPEASDRACMVVWRTQKWETPTGHPDEMWLFSGNVDRPTIIPAEIPEIKPVPTSDMRVSKDVFQRRVNMGWDPERARTTPLGNRAGSVQGKFTPSLRHADHQVDDTSVRLTAGMAPEVFTAFGMTRSIAEWKDLTGISENALRVGARKHGMEGYLKKKQWHPRWGKP